MGVSLQIYRAAIGEFNSFKISSVVYTHFVQGFLLVAGYMFLIMFFVCIVIILANDVQLNPGPVQHFSIGQLNVRSLNIREKFEELSFLIKENNFDVFAVCETWLNEHIPSDSFVIPGYNQIIRLDREGRMGGGVAFFTSESLVVKRHEELEINGFELLWIEFRVNQHHILCGIGYRPPNNDLISVNTFLNNFQTVLDKIHDLPRDYNVVIVGDFNAHYDAVHPQKSTDVGIQFHSFLEGNSLAQLISEPTRITSQYATILDVVITNRPVLFTNTGTLSPPSTCDHSIVFVQMNVRTFKCTSYKREIWNFNNVDFPGLNIAVLGIDWFSLFDSEFDIDNVYNTWVAQFHAIIEKYIPRKTVTIRPRDKPWMNGIVRRAIRRRNRLLRIHNKKRTELSWENYRRQRNLTTTLIRQAKQTYYDKVNAELSNPLTNIKKWWSISKNLCGKTYKSRIPTLIENDDLITNPREKACIFNDYFVAQTQLPGAGSSVVPNLPFYQSVTFLANICVTEDEILILMRSVDISKASGSDGIGNKMIKFCSGSLYLFFT